MSSSKGEEKALVCSLGDKKNSSCVFKSAKGWAQERIKESKEQKKKREEEEMRGRKKKNQPNQT